MTLGVGRISRNKQFLLVTALVCCILESLASANTTNSYCSDSQTVVDINLPFQNKTTKCITEHPGTNSIKCPNLSLALSLSDLNNKCLVLHSNQTLTTPVNISSVSNFTLTSTSNRQFNICVAEGFNLHFLLGYDIKIAQVGFTDCKQYIASCLRTSSIQSVLSFEHVQQTTIAFVSIYCPWRTYAIVLKVSSGKHSIGHLTITGNPGSNSKGIFIELIGKVNKEVDISDSNFTELSDFDAICDDEFPGCGNGSAIALYVGESVPSARISINGSFFRFNNATFGGGLYATFFNKVSDNVIMLVKNCTFAHNHARYTGGGIMITGYSQTDIRGSVNATIFLNNVKLYENIAEKGGGLAVSNLNSMPDCGGIFINDSHLMNNNAMLGGDVYALHSNLTLTNVVTAESHCPTPKTQTGYGSIMVHRTWLSVEDVHIRHHKGSGIILDNSNLLINGKLTLSSNKGLYGGGIAMYVNSRIHLAEHANLSFVDNHAENFGGGLYVSSSIYFDCFFQRQPTFNGSVSFINNTATYGTAVYTKTLRGCARNPDNFKNYRRILWNWTNFHFECHAIKPHKRCISTDPNNFSASKSDWDHRQPGIPFSIGFTLTDERGNEREMATQASITGNVWFSKENKSITEVSSTSLLYLFGKRGEMFSIEMSVSPYFYKRFTNLTLDNCSWPYSYKMRSCYCNATNYTQYGINLCKPGSVHLKPNVWKHPTLPKIYNCPIGYCFCNETLDSELYCLLNTKKQCAGDRTQNSTLCSRCKQGFAVVIGSNECWNCTEHSSNYWKVIGKTVGLDLLAIVIIVLLNIESSATYLNPVVYYYRLADVFLSSKVLPYDPVMAVVLSIFHRTDKMGSQCFTQSLNNLTKLWIEFGVTFSWLITYLLVYWIVYKRQLIPYVSKRIPRDAFYRSLITISLVVYLELINFGFKALHYEKIGTSWRVYVYADQEYLGNEHIPLFIVAVLVLLLVLFFIMVLIIYTLPFAHQFKKKSMDFILKKFSSVNIFFRMQISIFKQGDHRYEDRTWFPFAQYIILGGFCALGEYYFESARYLALNLCCLVYLVLHSYMQPYNFHPYNIHEVVILANLLLVGLLGEGMFSKDDEYAYGISCLRYLPIVSFIFWIVVHILRQCCKFSVYGLLGKTPKNESVLLIKPPGFVKDMNVM